MAKPDEKYVKRVTITVDVEVENRWENPNPLPTIEQVLAKWQSYCGGQLLGYKELPETFGAEMDFAVVATMVSMVEVVNIATEKAWVLNTSHIPEPTDTEHPPHLDFGNDHPRCDPHENGWTVYLTGEDERPCPEWFRPLMDVAVKNDVSFVVFDSAGNQYDDLPSYEW
jgi:hypothetical protein